MNAVTLQELGTALFCLLIAGVLYTGFLDWARHRRAYLDAVAAFRWDPNMSPTDFERHCADFLAIKGWSAKTTQGSGDQGVDVLAEKAGIRVVLQCKKYSRPVGNKAVQEAHAAKAFAKADRAAVVSNAAYTKGARALAQSTEVLLLHFTDLGKADQLFGVGFGSAGRSEDMSFFDRKSGTDRVKRSCPNCRVVLRLPVGRTGTVRCPECRNRFTATT